MLVCLCVCVFVCVCVCVCVSACVCTGLEIPASDTQLTESVAVKRTDSTDGAAADATPIAPTEDVSPPSLTLEEFFPLHDALAPEPELLARLSPGKALTISPHLPAIHPGAQSN